MKNYGSFEYNIKLDGQCFFSVWHFSMDAKIRGGPFASVSDYDMLVWRNRVCPAFVA